jgi:hypothetical protein
VRQFDEQTKQEARDELRRNTLPSNLDSLFRDNWTVRYDSAERTIIIEHTGSQPMARRLKLDGELKDMTYDQIAWYLGNHLLLFSIDALNYDLFPAYREQQIAKGEYNS